MRNRETRQLSSWSLLGLAALGLIPLTIYLSVAVPDFTLAGALVVLLCEVVVVAATTTLTVAVVTAAAAFLLVNWFLVPPYRTLFVASTDDVIVLLVFLGSAVAASLAVTRVLQAQRESALAEMEAGQLRDTVSAPATQTEPTEFLRRICEIYGMSEVALVDTDGRTVTRVVGDDDPEASSTVDVALADGYRLVGHGPRTIGQDPRLMVSLGNATLRSHEARELAQEAARAAALESLDRDRSALLASVGHDLRTPIATISVAAGTLASEVPVTEEVRSELARTIVDSAHRLDRLVTNLLDMSRLEAGQVVAHMAPTDVEEASAAAMVSLDADDVHLDIPESLPLAWADAGLLERVIANLVSNALRHSDGKQVELQARSTSDGIRISVVDHGAGLQQGDYERLFQPFATSGDRTPGGLGLGLAVSHRFCETMAAELRPTTTPGGGLTMTIDLRAAP